MIPIFYVINSSLTKVKTYVDEEGKLHFVDSEGADSVLPFSGGWEDFVIESLTADKTINIGRKPKELLIFWSANNVTIKQFNLFYYENEKHIDYTFGDGESNSYITESGFTVKCKYINRPVCYAYK